MYMEEVEGFEPPRVVKPLSVFKTDPFSRTWVYLRVTDKNYNNMVINIVSTVFENFFRFFICFFWRYAFMVRVLIFITRSPIKQCLPPVIY
jgi:hypothetical protein